MIEKRPIDTLRIRQVPRQFSWVDHRLVRERYIEHLSHGAAALYLFLLTVADAQGLSYYSDATLMKRLGMDESTLAEARWNLLRVDLIAYRKPLYQVLELLSLPTSGCGSFRAGDEPVSIGRIFKTMIGERP